MYSALYRQFMASAIILATVTCCLAQDARMSGSLRKWAPVTLDFAGPSATTADSTPNPFLDYRLQVKFTSPAGKTYDVPGFFDGDGQGAQAGAVWRVRFTPDEVGTWKYQASFRKGPQVAVSLDASAGEPAGFDGAAGAFEVVEQDPAAPGFHKWGRLEYVGQHYLKFRDGPYWLKGGVDEPENLLAYKGFAGTPRATHQYAAHVQDWREGDPDWSDGAGKGIIGAVNYLASRHVNSIYFMPMNIGGDGDDTWPYLSSPEGAAVDNLHFDVAKLAQWEVVFAHAQRQGLLLHFVLNEAEHGNKRYLDDTQLGPQRKLYYRELIARFSHHLAMQWNLCEEYGGQLRLGPDLVKAYAQYIHDVDPYDHPVTVHNAGTVDRAWGPFLGDRRFQITSFQTRDTSVVRAWREKSAAAGFIQVVNMDELWPDAAEVDNADRYRQQYVWPIYLSGGNLELILRELLATEDFRKYQHHWDNLWNARKLLLDLPFWEMMPADELLTEATTFAFRKKTFGGKVYAKAGQVYVVYLPVADGRGRLDLSAVPGEFVRQWYNPRTGEFAGDPVGLKGGQVVELGSPPSEVVQDWALLIRGVQGQSP